MFVREFITTLKLIVRDRSALFWVIIYPIILCGFFTLAFGGMQHPDVKPVSVAVAKDNPLAFVYRKIPILKVKETGDYENDLKEKKIAAYIDKNQNLVIGENGVDQTLVKMITDEVLQVIPLRERAMDFYMHSYGAYKNTGAYPYAMIFYSLIAMISLYGYFPGIYVSFNSRADLSPLGIRVSMGPVNKSTTIIASFLASCVTNFLSVLALLLSMKYIYRIQIIHNWPHTILISLMGMVLGTSLGVAIGSFRKFNIDQKVTFGIGITLFLSFLSGMMNNEIYFFINDKAPFINKLNPVARMMNSLIDVNILESTQSLPATAAVLLGTTVLLLIAGWAMIRGESYDSL